MLSLLSGVVPSEAETALATTTPKPRSVVPILIPGAVGCGVGGPGQPPDPGGIVLLSTDSPTEWRDLPHRLYTGGGAGEHR